MKSQAGTRTWGLVGTLVGLASLVAGCLAMVDPEDREFLRVENSPSGSAPSKASSFVLTVLPVYNGTGKRLRLQKDERLGALEGVLVAQDPAHPTIPELLQAGWLLTLDAEGQAVRDMGWTNGRIRTAPASVEEAWRAAIAARLDGPVVWVKLTGWEDADWRVRRAVRLSAEVTTFRAGEERSIQVRLIQDRRFLIPITFTSLAQAVGDVGGRLAREIGSP